MPDTAGSRSASLRSQSFHGLALIVTVTDDPALAGQVGLATVATWWSSWPA
jgi:hypothetical protein